MRTCKHLFHASIATQPHTHTNRVCQMLTMQSVFIGTPFSTVCTALSQLGEAGSLKTSDVHALALRRRTAALLCAQIRICIHNNIRQLNDALYAHSPRQKASILENQVAVGTLRHYRPNIDTNWHPLENRQGRAQNAPYFLHSLVLHETRRGLRTIEPKTFTMRPRQMLFGGQFQF